MVLCCVPSCDSESNRCESSITFHEFPSDPVLSEKWLKQINKIAAPPLKEPWSPTPETVICSKHFLQTNFNDDSNTLKPSSIPTVFGYKYIGYDACDEDVMPTVSDVKKSPLIVKVIKPAESELETTPPTSKKVKSKRNTSKNPSTATPGSSKVTKIFLSSPTSGLIKENPRSNSPSPSKIIQNIERASNSVLKSLQPGAMKACSSVGRSVIMQSKGNSNNCPVPVIPKMTSTKNSPIKSRKKGSPDNNLIEIGPNTFLKINPEVIKVNKKQTPSGNTVLQFVMSQKLANSSGTDMLPKLIQSVTGSGAASVVVQKTSVPPKKQPTTPTNDQPKKYPVVQHVVGHLVDTHVCKDSCEKLNEDMSCDEMVLDDTETIAPNDMEVDEALNSHLGDSSSKVKDKEEKSDKSGSSVLNKAPVLFTTNVPLSHCMLDKPKFMTQLRQKSRQIASLKFKITSLNKKIEDLEDKCIVQERQLSYSFIKKLKVIRKAATAGDPCATYILEQIRCYSGNSKMRWSDSTLSQCAVWCRKAPYAYEYFKKADFFKLPCLGTVKRFMKKHPELKLQARTNGGNPDNNSSSSDFDFDDSDSGNEEPDDNNQDGAGSTSAVLNSASMIIDPSMSQSVETSVPSTSGIIVAGTDNANKDKSEDIGTYPVTMDGTKLEVQEIILPSGEVVQCYSSNMCNGDLGNQYYIIPNVGDQTSDQEYNVVQSGESLPVILQNLDNAQLPLQQEQLIFITNSSEQVECSESEVIIS